MRDPEATESKEVRIITEPWLCLRCNYELSGLAHDGLCPECSLPINGHHAGPPIARVRRVNISKMRLGCLIILPGVLLHATTSYMLYDPSFTFGRFSVTLAILCASLLIIAVGMWLSIRPLRGSTRFRLLNLWARLTRTVVALVATALVCFILDAASLLPVYLPYGILWVLSTVLLISPPAMLVMNFVCFSLLASVMGNPRMARGYANAAIVVPPVSLVLWFVSIAAGLTAFAAALPTLAWCLGAIAMWHALGEHR